MPHAPPVQTCADLLAGIDAYLDPALVDGRARGRLHALGGVLPAALASSLWLECRLAGGARQVDLSLRVRPAGFPMIAGAAGPRVPLGAAGPLWARVRALARRSRHERALRDGVAALWLEHDLPDAAFDRGEVAAPGVFVQLHGDRAPRASLVAGALGALLGAPPAPALAARLHAALAAAPPALRPLQLGVMLSRGEPSVRLCFVFRDPAPVPRFLARLGWPGHPADAAVLLEPARSFGARFAGPMMLHLDVGAAGVRPRVGIDYRLDPRPQVRGGLHERPFLAAVQAAELADAAKVAGLHRWPGARPAAGRARAPRRLLVRRVSHLKLTYDPGTPPEAKAYLAFFTVRTPPAPAGS